MMSHSQFKTILASLISLSLFSVTQPAVADEYELSLFKDLNKTTVSKNLMKNDSFISNGEFLGSVDNSSGQELLNIDLQNPSEVNVIANGSKAAGDVVKHKDWAIHFSGETDVFASSNDLLSVTAVRGEEVLGEGIRALDGNYSSFSLDRDINYASIDQGFFFVAHEDDETVLMRFEDGVFETYMTFPETQRIITVDAVKITGQPDSLVIASPADDSQSSPTELTLIEPGRDGGDILDSVSFSDTIALMGSFDSGLRFHGSVYQSSGVTNGYFDLLDIFGDKITDSVDPFNDYLTPIIDETSVYLADFKFRGDGAYFKASAVNNIQANDLSVSVNPGIHYFESPRISFLTTSQGDISMNTIRTEVATEGMTVQDQTLTSIHDFLLLENSGEDGQIVFVAETSSKTGLFLYDIDQDSITDLQIDASPNQQLISDEQGNVYFTNIDSNTSQSVLVFKTNLIDPPTEAFRISRSQTKDSFIDAHLSHRGVEYFASQEFNDATPVEKTPVIYGDGLRLELDKDYFETVLDLIPVSENSEQILVVGRDEDFDESVWLLEGNSIELIDDALLSGLNSYRGYENFLNGAVLSVEDSSQDDYLVFAEIENDQLVLNTMLDRFGNIEFTAMFEVGMITADEDYLYFGADDPGRWPLGFRFDGVNLDYLIFPALDLTAAAGGLYGLANRDENGDLLEDGDSLHELDFDGNAVKRIPLEKEAGYKDNVSEIYDVNGNVCVGADPNSSGLYVSGGTMLYCLRDGILKPAFEPNEEIYSIDDVKVIDGDVYLLTTDDSALFLTPDDEFYQFKKRLFRLEDDQLSEINTGEALLGPELFELQGELGVVLKTSEYGYEPWVISQKSSAPSFSAPAPFQGPVITNAELEGTELVISGNNLELISSVLIGENELSATAQDNQLLVDVSDLPAGDYQVGYSYSGSDITTQFSVNLAEITSESQASVFWTKQVSPSEIKLYAKNVVGSGKVQFFHNGQEVAWVRAEDASDEKLRVISSGPMTGANYLVRTREMVEGKNVFEIYVDGERVLRRAQGN